MAGTLDLAHLTVAEQNIILDVLKRDDKIRQVDEQRISALKTKSIKYSQQRKKSMRVFTGEWFKDVARQVVSETGTYRVRQSIRRSKPKQMRVGLPNTTVSEYTSLKYTATYGTNTQTAITANNERYVAKTQNESPTYTSRCKDEDDENVKDKPYVVNEERDVAATIKSNDESQGNASVVNSSSHTNGESIDKSSKVTASTTSDTNQHNHAVQGKKYTTDKAESTADSEVNSKAIPPVNETKSNKNQYENFQDENTKYKIEGIDKIAPFPSKESNATQVKTRGQDQSITTKSDGELSTATPKEENIPGNRDSNDTPKPVSYNKTKSETAYDSTDDQYYDKSNTTSSEVPVIAIESSENASAYTNDVSSTKTGNKIPSQENDQIPKYVKRSPVKSSRSVGKQTSKVKSQRYKYSTAKDHTYSTTDTSTAASKPGYSEDKSSSNHTIEYGGQAKTTKTSSSADALGKIQTTPTIESKKISAEDQSNASRLGHITDESDKDDLTFPLKQSSFKVFDSDTKIAHDTSLNNVGNVTSRTTKQHILRPRRVGLLSTAESADKASISSEQTKEIVLLKDFQGDSNAESGRTSSALEYSFKKDSVDTKDGTQSTQKDNMVPSTADDENKLTKDNIVEKEVREIVHLDSEPKHNRLENFKPETVTFSQTTNDVVSSIDDSGQLNNADATSVRSEDTSQIENNMSAASTTVNTDQTADTSPSTNANDVKTVPETTFNSSVDVSQSDTEQLKISKDDPDNSSSASGYVPIHDKNTEHSSTTDMRMLPDSGGSGYVHEELMHVGYSDIHEVASFDNTGTLEEPGYMQQASVTTAPQPNEEKDSSKETDLWHGNGFDTKISWRRRSVRKSQRKNERKQVIEQAVVPSQSSKMFSEPPAVASKDAIETLRVQMSDQIHDDKREELNSAVDKVIDYITHDFDKDFNTEMALKEEDKSFSDFTLAEVEIRENQVSVQADDPSMLHEQVKFNVSSSETKEKIEPAKGSAVLTSDNFPTITINEDKGEINLDQDDIESLNIKKKQENDMQTKIEALNQVSYPSIEVLKTSLTSCNDSDQEPMSLMEFLNSVSDINPDSPLDVFDVKQTAEYHEEKIVINQNDGLTHLGGELTSECEFQPVFAMEDELAMSTVLHDTLNAVEESLVVLEEIKAKSSPINKRELGPNLWNKNTIDSEDLDPCIEISIDSDASSETSEDISDLSGEGLEGDVAGSSYISYCVDEDLADPVSSVVESDVMTEKPKDEEMVNEIIPTVEQSSAFIGKDIVDVKFGSGDISTLIKSINMEYDKLAAPKDSKLRKEGTTKVDKSLHESEKNTEMMKDQSTGVLLPFGTQISSSGLKASAFVTDFDNIDLTNKLSSSKYVDVIADSPTKAVQVQSVKQETGGQIKEFSTTVQQEVANDINVSDNDNRIIDVSGSEVTDDSMEAKLSGSGLVVPNVTYSILIQQQKISQTTAHDIPDMTKVSNISDYENINVIENCTALVELGTDISNITADQQTQTLLERATTDDKRSENNDPATSVAQYDGKETKFPVVDRGSICDEASASHAQEYRLNEEGTLENSKIAEQNPILDSDNVDMQIDTDKESDIAQDNMKTIMSDEYLSSKTTSSVQLDNTVEMEDHSSKDGSLCTDPTGLPSSSEHGDIESELHASLPDDHNLIQGPKIHTIELDINGAKTNSEAAASKGDEESKSIDFLSTDVCNDKHMHVGSVEQSLDETKQEDIPEHGKAEVNLPIAQSPKQLNNVNIAVNIVEDKMDQKLSLTEHEENANAAEIEDLSLEVNETGKDIAFLSVATGTNIEITPNDNSQEVNGKINLTFEDEEKGSSEPEDPAMYVEDIQEEPTAITMFHEHSKYLFCLSSAKISDNDMHIPINVRDSTTTFPCEVESIEKEYPLRSISYDQNVDNNKSTDFAEQQMRPAFSEVDIAPNVSSDRYNSTESKDVYQTQDGAGSSAELVLQANDENQSMSLVIDSISHVLVNSPEVDLMPVDKSHSQMLPNTIQVPALVTECEDENVKDVERSLQKDTLVLRDGGEKHPDVTAKEIEPLNSSVISALPSESRAVTVWSTDEVKGLGEHEIPEGNYEAAEHTGEIQESQAENKGSKKVKVVKKIRKLPKDNSNPDDDTGIFKRKSGRRKVIKRKHGNEIKEVANLYALNESAAIDHTSTVTTDKEGELSKVEGIFSTEEAMQKQTQVLETVYSESNVTSEVVAIKEQGCLATDAENLQKDHENSLKIQKASSELAAAESETIQHTEILQELVKVDESEQNILTEAQSVSMVEKGPNASEVNANQIMDASSELAAVELEYSLLCSPHESPHEDKSSDESKDTNNFSIKMKNTHENEPKSSYANNGNVEQSTNFPSNREDNTPTVKKTMDISDISSSDQPSPMKRKKTVKRKVIKKKEDNTRDISKENSDDASSKHSYDESGSPSTDKKFIVEEKHYDGRLLQDVAIKNPEMPNLITESSTNIGEISPLSGDNIDRDVTIYGSTENDNTSQFLHDTILDNADTKYSLQSEPSPLSYKALFNTNTEGISPKEENTITDKSDDASNFVRVTSESEVLTIDVMQVAVSEEPPESIMQVESVTSVEGVKKIDERLQDIVSNKVDVGNQNSAVDTPKNDDEDHSPLTASFPFTQRVSSSDDVTNVREDIITDESELNILIESEPVPVCEQHSDMIQNDCLLLIAAESKLSLCEEAVSTGSVEAGQSELNILTGNEQVHAIEQNVDEKQEKSNENQIVDVSSDLIAVETSTVYPDSQDTSFLESEDTEISSMQQDIDLMVVSTKTDKSLQSQVLSSQKEQEDSAISSFYDEDMKANQCSYANDANDQSSEFLNKDDDRTSTEKDAKSKAIIKNVKKKIKKDSDSDQTTLLLKKKKTVKRKVIRKKQEDTTVLPKVSDITTVKDFYDIAVDTSKEREDFTDTTQPGQLDLPKQLTININEASPLADTNEDVQIDTTANSPGGSLSATSGAREQVQSESFYISHKDISDPKVAHEEFNAFPKEGSDALVFEEDGSLPKESTPNVIQDVNLSDELSQDTMHYSTSAKGEPDNTVRDIGQSSTDVSSQSAKGIINQQSELEERNQIVGEKVAEDDSTSMERKPSSRKRVIRRKKKEGFSDGISAIAEHQTFDEKDNRTKDMSDNNAPVTSNSSTQECGFAVPGVEATNTEIGGTAQHLENKPKPAGDDHQIPTEIAATEDSFPVQVILPLAVEIDDHEKEHKATSEGTKTVADEKGSQKMIRKKTIKKKKQDTEVPEEGSLRDAIPISSAGSPKESPRQKKKIIKRKNVKK